MKDRFMKGAAWLTTAVTLVSSVFSAVPVVSAATVFNDVTGSTSYYQGIMWAYDHGIIQGYGNGNFGPDDCVRRGELVKMIVNYAHTGSALVGSVGSDPGFWDVPSTAWFYPFVKEAKYKSYIQGYADGSFKPNICVNRAEAMKIAYGALLTSQTLDSSGNPVMYDDKLVTDIPVYAWFAPYARTLFKNRLVGTNHTTWDTSASTNFRAILFFPSGSMTRKEVAEMLYRISGFTGSTPTPAPTPGPTTAGKPVLTLPANGIVLDQTTTGVNFQFLPTTGVSNYQLALKMPGNNDFGWWDITSTSLNTNGYIAYFMSRGSSGFLNTNGTYYWKIRAWNSNRTSYTDSDTWTMSNPGSSSSITLQSPVSGTSYNYGSTVNFQWQDSNIPSGGLHGVQMSCANNNYPTTDHWLEWDTTNTSQYSMQTSSVFTPNNTSGFNFSSDIYCKWRVVFYTTSGNPSSLLATSNETRNLIFRVSSVTLTAPGLVYPANNANYYGSNPQLTVTWSPAQGAARYDLMVLFGGTSTYKVYPVNGNYTTNMSYYVPISDFPALTQNYMHRWKVRAYDAYNNYTESPEWVFNVYTSLPAPTLYSPAAGAVFSNFPRTTFFQWSSVSGAASYQLELGCDVCSGGASYSNPTYYSTSSTSMSQTMAGANSFRFRVRAMDGSGAAGAWSEYRYFSYSV